MLNTTNTGSRRHFLNKLTAMIALAYLGLVNSNAQRNVANTQIRDQKLITNSKSLKEYKLSLKSDGLKAKNVLNELVNLIERMPDDQAQVTNNQQQYQTLFENFDQKTNQVMSILSNILKSLKEMQSSTIRNAL